MRPVYLILLPLLFAPAAPADGLPDLGDVSQTVLSPLQEQAIAEQILRDVNTSTDVVHDVEVVDYLQALGYRLAANSPDNRQRFTFFVVRDSSINAFAMPGGVIGVHTGLLLASQSESELAGVLAHEIGHVVQRHLARMIAQQRRDTLPSMAAMALAILMSRANPQLASGAMQAAQAGAVQKQLDYTREHEREADRVGVQILDRAGFDARAMPSFLETLMRGTRFYEGSAPSFLRTHPLTTERIADVRNRAETLPYRQVADSAEFHYVRAKLRAAAGSPQQAIAWFEQHLQEGKFASGAAQHYGLALACLRAGDLERTRQEVAWIRTHTAPHPMVEVLAAGLLRAAGNTAQADMHFRQSLRTFPGHRALIYGSAELALETGKADAAVRLLKEKQLIFPDDAYLYELESRAHAGLGKALLHHQAQGEAYYRRYNLTGAVEQMELALRSGDGDFYQLSIVEARLKQLRQMLVPPKEKGFFD